MQSTAQYCKTLQKAPQSAAKQSAAKQSAAKQSTATHCKTKQSNRKPYKTLQSTAKQSKAPHLRALQCKSPQSTETRCTALQSKAKHRKALQLIVKRCKAVAQRSALQQQWRSSSNLATPHETSRRQLCSAYDARFAIAAMVLASELSTNASLFRLRLAVPRLGRPSAMRQKNTNPSLVQKQRALRAAGGSSGRGHGSAAHSLLSPYFFHL